MTFEDDFCRIHFLTGNKMFACTQLGLEWPPPEVIDFGGFQFERTDYSKITDEQREGMTHVVRGAEYQPLEKPYDI